MTSVNRAASPFWKGVNKFTELFHQFTISEVGDGMTTSLWFDLWWGAEALRKTLPSLFSFTTNKNISLASHVTDLDQNDMFRSIMTSAANSEAQVYRTHNFQQPWMSGNGDGQLTKFLQSIIAMTSS